MIEMRDLYWSAGFLEAEGSFHFGKARNFIVSAMQIEKEPLDHLQELFGGCINKVWLKYRNKFIYRWEDGRSCRTCNKIWNAPKLAEKCLVMI